MKLTDCLAVYGACVSTATAAWNYFRAQSQVRVVLIDSFQKVQDEYQLGIEIAIQNVSTQTVHITNVSLLYPFRKSTFRSKLQHLVRYRHILRNAGWCHCSLSLHGIEDGCPVSVEPGKSHLIFVRHEVLGEILKDAQSPRVKAAAQDALWRNTYSKVFEWPTQQKALVERVE